MRNKILELKLNANKYNYKNNLYDRNTFVCGKSKRNRNSNIKS